MQELAAINIALAQSGNGRVNELDAADAKASQAQSVLRRVRKEVLTFGYPINTNEVDLAVDANGRVPISASYLKVFFPESYSYRVLSGTRYVWDLVDSDYHDTAMTDVPVVFDIATFTDLPESLALWIAWKAAEEFFIEDKGRDAPAMLQRKVLHMQAGAVNAMPIGNFHDVSGWTAVQFPGSGTTVRTAGRWVVL